jgi:predicted chitinase
MGRFIVAIALAVLACSVYASSLRRFANTLADEVFPLSDSFGQCTTTAALNVRSAPSTSGTILRTLAQGASVNVISTSNGWSQIGNSEYVSATYLTNCGAPAPAPSPSKGGITTQQLRAIMPNLSQSKADLYISHLNSGMAEAQINTCPRISAFLAQLAHESGQLIYWEELASGAAYEGRKDLGNTQPGDGVRFKGRGPIQLTGRSNYRAAGNSLGLPLEANPKMVSEVSVGFRTTLWFWNSRGLSNYADKNDQANFDTITRRINGGTNGKADRDQYWRKAKSVLGC